jgi:hypothetical protein
VEDSKNKKEMVVEHSLERQQLVDHTTTCVCENNEMVFKDPEMVFKDPFTNAVPGSMFLVRLVPEDTHYRAVLKPTDSSGGGGGGNGGGWKLNGWEDWKSNPPRSRWELTFGVHRHTFPDGQSLGGGSTPGEQLFLEPITVPHSLTFYIYDHTSNQLTIVAHFTLT